MLKKLRFIVPLLALAALVVWWFTPRYSEEDEAYYRSVFCLIDHHDSRAFLHDMESVVEGGNSDYALHKIRYIPALGEKMRQTWQQLSPDEQRASREDRQRCYGREEAGLSQPQADHGVRLLARRAGRGCWRPAFYSRFASDFFFKL